MPITHPARQTILDLPDGFYEYYNVEFDIYSRRYFETQATGLPGHFALVMRGDLALQATAVWGQGLTFGNASGSQPTPTPRIETWFNGIPPGNYLLDGASGVPTLLDEVEYHFKYFSHITPNRSTQTIRFLVYQDGNMLYDSGLVNDPNLYFNPAKNSIYAGHVFDNTADPDWDFKIYNLTLQRW